MKARQSSWGILVVAGVIAALAITVVSGAIASGHGQRGGHKVSCSGPDAIGGSLELARQGKVTGKRTDCATARKVVKSFSESCTKAYTAQGRCKIRAEGRWRCRSQIVGSYESGAPSKEKCSHGRARLRFTVEYVPATDELVIPSSSTVERAPFDPTRKCIDTSQAGNVIPPPNPKGLGNFEIHLLRGVPTSVGEGLQTALVGHRVMRVLHAGLGSETRNEPARIPIFVIPDTIDPTNPGATGVTAETCANPAVNAIVVTTKLGPNPPPQHLKKNGAHELFHAFAFYGIFIKSGGSVSSVPWWEDASAEWSLEKVGLPTAAERDIALQYPNIALDSTENAFQYAMWRFVQFLDVRGLIGGDPAWPLQRYVVARYEEGATLALSQAITRANSSTSLGAELAAFWGDRLKEKPLRAPQVVPTAANLAGGKPIEITPDVSKIPATAQRLHTKLFDFKLTNEVQRVTFEFDPPDDGYFWGLTKPDESERFRKDDSVTFCVGGSDDPDMLKWPGHFPVTFTNGSLNTGEIKGEITVRGSKDAGQCQPPTPDNRACQILGDARVSELLGPGSFPFHSDSRDSQQVVWVCFYHGDQGEVNLNLARNLRASAREVRKGVKRQIEQLNLDRLDGVGDLAGIGTFTDDDGKNYGIVVMAVGKENALFIIGPGAQRQNAKTLAKRIAGQID